MPLVRDFPDRRQAAAIYASIARQHGRDPVDPATKQAIRDDCLARFGSTRHVPWLMVYAAWRGGFRPGWMPHDFYRRTVVPAINGRHRSVSNVKTLSARLLNTALLPDLLYRIGGLWLDRDGAPLSESAVEHRMFAVGDTVFVKRDGTSAGRGVMQLRRCDFGRTDFARLGDFVVQSAVRQHAWFARMVPGPVATLRVTTLKTGGAPARNVAAFLRLGRAGGAAVGIDALDVAVVDEHGTLDPLASDADWCRHAAHPDTGVAFAGLAVPGFGEAVRICADLHDRFPHFQIIGWDVAFDATGAVVLLEWNADYPDIAFVDAAVGPRFADLGWERLAVRR